MAGFSVQGLGLRVFDIRFTSSGRSLEEAFQLLCLRFCKTMLEAQHRKHNPIGGAAVFESLRTTL